MVKCFKVACNIWDLGQSQHKVLVVSCIVLEIRWWSLHRDAKILMKKSRCQKSARTLHNTLLQVMISHHLSRCRGWAVMHVQCTSVLGIFSSFLVTGQETAETPKTHNGLEPGEIKKTLEINAVILCLCKVRGWRRKGKLGRAHVKQQRLGVVHSAYTNGLVF